MMMSEIQSLAQTRAAHDVVLRAPCWFEHMKYMFKVTVRNRTICTCEIGPRRALPDFCNVWMKHYGTHMKHPDFVADHFTFTIERRAISDGKGTALFVSVQLATSLEQLAMDLMKANLSLDQLAD